MSSLVEKGYNKKNSIDYEETFDQWHKHEFSSNFTIFCCFIWM